MDVLLRSIGLFFDEIVYNFIITLYDLFMEISNLTLLSDTALKEFGNRLYALLGVLMLFKVTFSLITYLVNPDSLSDNSKGLGSIVKRIIISLAMIAIVPTIFTLAFRLQTLVLDNNVLANVIIGGNYASESATFEIDQNPGDSMAFGVLSSFIHPTETYKNWATKSDLYADPSDDEKEIAGTYRSYRDAIELHDIGNLIDLATAKDDDGEFIFDYTSFISTIAGAFVCYTLVVYCIQIGLRSVKLAFLQLIAPIPILAYVDPKSGEGTFKAWLKSCGTTYLDIFVRLIIIYFVVLMISLLTQDGIFQLYRYNTDGTTVAVEDVSFAAQAFIIIGLLMFAMEAPKLVPQILGLSSNGNYSLSVKKALGGAATPLAIGAGVVAGGVGSAAINTIMTAKKSEGTVGQRIRHSISSGAKGLVGGAYRGIQNKTKFATTWSQTTSARKLSEKGYGLNARFQDKLADITGETYAGGTTDYAKSQMASNNVMIQNLQQTQQALSNAISGLMQKSPKKTVSYQRTFKFNPNLINDGPRKGEVDYNINWKYKDASGNEVSYFDKDRTLKDVDYSDYLDFRKVSGDTSFQLSRQDFDSMKESYIELQSVDNQERKLQKANKDLQDNMDKFKGK